MPAAWPLYVQGEKGGGEEGSKREDICTICCCWDPLLRRNSLSLPFPTNKAPLPPTYQCWWIYLNPLLCTPNHLPLAVSAEPHTTVAQILHCWKVPCISRIKVMSDGALYRPVWVFKKSVVGCCKLYQLHSSKAIMSSFKQPSCLHCLLEENNSMKEITSRDTAPKKEYENVYLHCCRTEYLWVTNKKRLYNEIENWKFLFLFLKRLVQVPLG